MAHIILLDDSRSIRRAVRTVLEGDGHQVDTCDQWVDMRRQVTSNPGAYDLALLDVSLPAQRSGDELAGWLRSLEGCANMRIVLFSAQSKQRLEALAVNAGVDAVISKQDGPQAFLAEVRRVLAGQASIGEEWPVE